MGKKLAIGFLAAMIMLLAAYSSYAQMCSPGDGMRPMTGAYGRGMGMMGPGYRMWRGLMGLSLTEKQRTEIDTIRSRTMKETIRKMADIRIAKVELKDILDKDPVDMKTAEGKVRQIESLHTDIHLSHIKAMEEAKAVLTSEQREELRKLRGKPWGRQPGRIGMNSARDGNDEMRPPMEPMNQE